MPAVGHSITFRFETEENPHTTHELFALLTSQLRLHTSTSTRKTLLFGHERSSCCVYDSVADTTTMINLEPQFTVRCAIQLRGEHKIICGGISSKLLEYDFFDNIVSYAEIEGLRAAYTMIQLYDGRIAIGTLSSMILLSSTLCKLDEIFFRYVAEETQVYQLKNEHIICTQETMTKIYHPRTLEIMHTINHYQPGGKNVLELSNGTFAISNRAIISIYDSKYTYYCLQTNKRDTVIALAELDNQLLVTDFSGSLSFWDTSTRKWNNVKQIDFNRYNKLIVDGRKIIMLGIGMIIYDVDADKWEWFDHNYNCGVTLVEHKKTMWTAGNRLEKSPLIHDAEKQRKISENYCTVA